MCVSQRLLFKAKFSYILMRVVDTRCAHCLLGIPLIFIKFFEFFILQYSALELGGHGGGGEYDIQIGFGWTNGVIMDLLAKYGDKLTSTGPLLKS